MIFSACSVVRRPWITGPAGLSTDAQIAPKTMWWPKHRASQLLKENTFSRLKALVFQPGRSSLKKNSSSSSQNKQLLQASGRYFHHVLSQMAESQTSFILFQTIQQLHLKIHPLHKLHQCEWPRGVVFSVKLIDSSLLPREVLSSECPFDTELKFNSSEEDALGGLGGCDAPSVRLSGS